MGPRAGAALRVGCAEGSGALARRSAAAATQQVPHKKSDLPLAVPVVAGATFYTQTFDTRHIDIQVNPVIDSASNITIANNILKHTRVPLASTKLSL